MRYRIKICCIQDLAEAETAIRHGASFLGMIPAEAPATIPAERIAMIAAAVPPGVTTVLVSAAQSVAELVLQHGRCHTGAVQLVRTLAAGSLREIRAELPGVQILQTVHVTGPEAIDEARSCDSEVDFILLDSGNPGAAGVEELGGTGRVHDWNISRAIVEACRRPVFLAGGVRPENIAEAAHRVDPYGFDLCTGVRVGGRLQEDALRALRAAVPG